MFVEREMLSTGARHDAVTAAEAPTAAAAVGAVDTCAQMLLCIEQSSVPKLMSSSSRDALRSSGSSRRHGGHVYNTPRTRLQHTADTSTTHGGHVYNTRRTRLQHGRHVYKTRRTRLQHTADTSTTQQTRLQHTADTFTTHGGHDYNTRQTRI